MFMQDTTLGENIASKIQKRMHHLVIWVRDKNILLAFRGSLIP